MRNISVTLLLFVLALSGTITNAGVAPSATPGPMTCPLYCPSQPAGIGAGPEPQIESLLGSDFNLAYIQAMYKQHTNTAAFVAQTIPYVSDKTLRDLSGNILREQTDLTQKMANWYSQLTGTVIPSASDQRVMCDISNLQGYCARDFDIEYAFTLINYLEQTQNAAQIGVYRLTLPDVRKQAIFATDSARKEVIALRRWLEISSPPVNGIR